MLTLSNHALERIEERFPYVQIDSMLKDLDNPVLYNTLSVDSEGKETRALLWDIHDILYIVYGHTVVTFLPKEAIRKSTSFGRKYDRLVKSINTYKKDARDRKLQVKSLEEKVLTIKRQNKENIKKERKELQEKTTRIKEKYNNLHERYKQSIYSLTLLKGIICYIKARKKYKRKEKEIANNGKWEKF